MSTKKIQILGSLGNKIYMQNEEPADAENGALWVDLDEDGSNLSSGANGTSREAKIVIITDIEGEDTTGFSYAVALSMSYDEIISCILAGNAVYAKYNDIMFPLTYTDNGLIVFGTTMAQKQSGNEVIVVSVSVQVYSDGTAYVNYSMSKMAIQLPTTLPNPEVLIINNTIYDGSELVNITGEIEALIDSKLGVIENGSY